MKTTLLKEIRLSTEMMNANQISSFTNETYEKKDYTAFEVFPTNKIIPAGTIDSCSKQENLSSLANLFNWSDDICSKLSSTCTGLTYIEDASSCDEVYIQFYTTRKKEETDIIVDWGDGQKTIIQKDEVVVDDNGEFIVMHKYSVPNMRYVVKASGEYYMIRCWTSKQNIISRVFQNDLPVSSKVKNISSLCRKSDRLLAVQVTSNFSFKNITNIANIFSACNNLLHVSYPDSITGHKFAYCGQLYRECPNLSTDINMLIKPFKYGTSEKDCQYVFYKDTNIGGILSDDGIFWNDPVEDWSKYKSLITLFMDSNISSQVPSEFGGPTANKAHFKFRTDIQNAISASSDLTELIEYAGLKPTYFESQAKALIDAIYIEPKNTSLTKFEVSVPSDNFEFKIGKMYFNEKFISYVIDWGDGITEKNSSDANITHTYDISGKYTVTINNHLNTIAFGTVDNFSSTRCVTPLSAADTYKNYNIIPDCAYSYMQISSFDNVIDNSKITDIGKSAFFGCSYLSSIDFPNCETIKSHAFNSFANKYWNNAILDAVRINLPKVKVLPEKSFESAHIKNPINFDMSNIEELGTRCFNSAHIVTCKFKHLKKIGVEAFRNIAYISTIDLTENEQVPELVNINAFTTIISANWKILVSQDKLNAYKTADVWKDIPDIDNRIIVS